MTGPHFNFQFHKKKLKLIIFYIAITDDQTESSTESAKVKNLLAINEALQGIFLISRIYLIF